MNPLALSGFSGSSSQGIYLNMNPYPHFREQWLEVAIIDDNLGYVLVVSSPFTERLVPNAMEPVRTAVYVALLNHWLKNPVALKSYPGRIPTIKF